MNELTIKPTQCNLIYIGKRLMHSENGELITVWTIHAQNVTEDKHEICYIDSFENPAQLKRIVDMFIESGFQRFIIEEFAYLFESMQAYALPDVIQRFKATTV